MEQNIKIRARFDNFANGHEVLISLGKANAKPIVFSDTDVGSPIVPTVPPEFGTAFLQSALNAAWDMGLRPDGYHDVREQMASTVRHLEDMRAITFHKLGVEKP